MDVVEICMIERESRSKGIVKDGETRPRRSEWRGKRGEE